MLDKVKAWYRELPDKKRYIEVITALLTIPVLVTVIISNVGRIQEDKNQDKITSSAKENKVIIITQGNKQPPLIQPTTKSEPTQVTKECKKQIGPISITSPKEEEVVESEPVCVQIEYAVGEFCSVAWSYRLDNGKWSNYTSSSFCFSNLSPGKHELDIRIQSVVSDDELTIERVFYYQTKESPKPTANPTPSL